MMDRTQDEVKGIGENLKAMDKQNATAEKGGKVDQQELRMRKSMHVTLTKKFMELAQDYQSLQERYKTAYKERVERQYKIGVSWREGRPLIRAVNPQASREEMERVLEGDTSQIFANQLLSPSQLAARSALEDIQERHRDIQRLEQSIGELYQLFVDMSVLVSVQGELLNQIEFSVQQAAEHVEGGIGELNKAKDYQKSARKVRRAPGQSG